MTLTAISQDSQERRRIRFAVACVLALATLLGAYSNSFQNEFHFDDIRIIVDNLYLRSLKHIPRFFRDASTYAAFPTSADYRPLVSTTLAVDYWIGGGLDRAQFHRSQLAMLALLGILVFFTFLRVLNLTEEHPANRYIALAAAALHSMHTTNTETMNIIQVRSELLSALGLVGSFVAYLYLPRSRRGHLYLAPMAIGAFAKPTTVLFAPIFLVYLLLFEEGLTFPEMFTARSRARTLAAIRKALPAFALGGTAYVFTQAMSPRTYEAHDRIAYLLSQCFAWPHYVRLFFLPIGLSADNAWPLVPHWYDTRVFAGVAFISWLILLAWTSSKAPLLRPVAFGLAWFGIALAPTSTIIPLNQVVSDHRPFLPFIGLSLAAVWGLTFLARHWAAQRTALRPYFGPVACTVALLAIGANAVGTYARNTVFRSRASFWGDVIAKDPTNGRALMEFGLAPLESGKLVEAKQLFERARVYRPNLPPLEINLGIISGGFGEAVDAESHFRKALQMSATNPGAHAYYARWLLTQRRFDEAIAHLQQAVGLSPSNEIARNLLLEAYRRTGRTEDLKALAEGTLRLAPGDARAREYLEGRGGIVLLGESAAPSADTPER